MENIANVPTINTKRPSRHPKRHKSRYIGLSEIMPFTYYLTLGKTMKNTKALKTILFLSGLLVIAIGAVVLFAPQLFYASNGIELGNNSSLMSEIRAPGAGLLICGVLILLGIFVKSLTFPAILLSTMLFLSYGSARVFSMVLDGMPTQNLVWATVIEFAFGLLGLFAIVKYSERNPQSLH